MLMYKWGPIFCFKNMGLRLMPFFYKGKHGSAYKQKYIVIP